MNDGKIIGQDFQGVKRQRNDEGQKKEDFQRGGSPEKAAKAKTACHGENRHAAYVHEVNREPGSEDFLIRTPGVLYQKDHRQTEENEERKAYNGSGCKKEFP
jgi:hypothetical protein